jgi:TonB-linked SusC/RagA family outer membrane protein
MSRFTRVVLTLSLSVFSVLLSAQSITGTVYDDQGSTLPGANVLVVNQEGKGAVTDMDGRFEIKNVSPGNVVLEFSFIGFEDKIMEINVPAEGIDIEVTLKEAQDQLDEVVVVGYGVKRRREISGSVVKLDAKEINDMPAPSFENALQGKAAGVQIITGSGLAASPSVVRIRGTASISAAGDPLYVVDGIPVTQDYFINGNSGGMNNNPLATLNPNDIESVEILKDASATAIYGSRGANGVIIITTKRGKQGGLQFGFNTTQGISTPTKRPEMLNAREYLQIYEEAWVNDGRVGTPSFSFVPTWSWQDAVDYANSTNGVGTDWVDQTIGTGYKQFYDFNVQKGSEKYNFYAGFSYDNNESYLKNNSYERLSGRINGDYRFSDKFRMGITTSLSRGDNNRVDAAWSGGLGAAMSTALPIYPIYWEDYNIDASNGDTLDAPGDFWLEAGVGNNPVAAREKRKWRVRELRSINSLNLVYTPTNRLSFNANGSYDFMKQTEDVYLAKELHGFSDIENGIAIRTPRTINNWNAFGTVSYDFNVGEDHGLTVMGGMEYQQSQNRLSSIKETTDSGDVVITNVVLNVTEPLYESNALDTISFDSTYFEANRRFNFISYFTRVNYNYKGKYYAQAVFRADGSSKFGPNSRFGYFPSLGVHWIVSEEDWFKNNKVINFMKVKASYGYVGSAGIDPNQWRSDYYEYDVGYGGNYGTGPSRLPNPNLQWESALNFDAGVELGLFEDRISAEAAYYHKTSRDVFLQIGVPQYFGVSTYWDNVAEILNTGVELTVNSRNTTGKLQWTTNFNIAYNYNEILSIGGYSEDAISGGTNDTRTIVGEPVGTNFLVRFSHVDPDNGRPVYFDLEGNQTYSWDPANRVPVGKIYPDAVGGITNTFRYGQWDLSFLFVYSIGNDIYDSSSKRQLGRVDEWNKTPLFYDRWQKPGDVAKYPLATLDEANHGSTTPWINTDLYLHDGSYMRLRNLTVAYNLPSKVLDKIKMKSLRIAFVGTNLLTFTRFPGVDPEIARDFENATDRNMSPNITYLTPPQERVYSIVLNATF